MSPVVRAEILDELEKDTDPRIGPALERRLLNDPDPDIAVASLEVLRHRATSPLLDLLNRRIAAVRTAGDAKQLRRLAEEQERWTSVVRGGLLPTFMQQPPPPFAAAPAGWPVRILAFGDFGDGSDSQKHVAASMLSYHTRQRFDFAITLGDNFYSTGMASPDDERWKTWCSDLSDPLRIPFYATLGNHDWGQPNSPAAEILFSQRSPSWRMPAAYYTFTAGDAQFFALDTDVISEKQLLWLKDALDASKARWKVVYGHHPIYSKARTRTITPRSNSCCRCCATARTSTWPVTITTCSISSPKDSCTSSLPDRAGNCVRLSQAPGHCLRRAPTASPYWRCSVSPSRRILRRRGQELYRYALRQENNY